MNASIRRGLYSLVVARGLVVLGAAAASAADNPTSGNLGLVAGNQVVAPVKPPVTISGNAISGIGHSKVAGSGAGSGTSTGGTPSGSAVTSGDEGVASGNQVVAPVNAPVTIGGNAISGIGHSTLTGSGLGSGLGSGPGSSTGASTSGSAVTSGDEGVASGNQVIVPVNAPVTIAGNSSSIIGDATVVGSGPNPPAASPTPGSISGSTPSSGPNATPGSTPGSAASPAVVGSVQSVRAPGKALVTAASATIAALASTGANLLLPLGIALLFLMFGGLLSGRSRRYVRQL